MTNRPSLGGATQEEKFLSALAKHSFLSLWSYPNPYRDQRSNGSQTEGKEICDLLVVFENTILIFSDKACNFPRTGNVIQDWARWYRKAVRNAADQLYGAERWILQNSGRVFLDRKCTIPFPLRLPNASDAVVHRIVVAHNVSARCREELGGSGSLMIAPRIKGDAHHRGGDVMPFSVGHVCPERGFVHVFDDTSLQILFSALDTISDFIDYLVKKETFIESGRLCNAAGEEELLGVYLRETNQQGEHDFVFRQARGEEVILLGEGFWDTFTKSVQRRRQVEANRISYAWDRLIEKFAHHITNGTSYYPRGQPVGHHEQALRAMAREPRTRRRLLARGIIDLLENTHGSRRRARIISSDRNLPCYVFLAFPRADEPYSEYRDQRRTVLEAYCRVAKLIDKRATEIVGIATEPGVSDDRSEDLIVLDVSEWTAEQQAAAKEIQAETGILMNLRQTTGVEPEYPTADEGKTPRGTVAYRSKIGRNDPCPCASGRKYKRCCGNRYDLHGFPRNDSAADHRGRIP